jgi:gluconokinase
MRLMSSRVVIIAGPAGSGKTTVGHALATVLGADFVDGDDLHPPANVEEMRSGQRLDEDDRRPWLAAARMLIDQRLAAGALTVLALSALRRAHRAALGADRSDVRLVWLESPAHALATRLASRPAHFFPAALLGSQLADLEPPRDDEHPVMVDADRPVDAVVDSILTALKTE